MIIDYLDNLSFEEKKDYEFDARMTLAKISNGLFWLYVNVLKIERQVRAILNKENVLISLVNGPLENVPLDWLSCAFQWYAVSAYNYVRLVGWLALKDNISINNYINRVIPRLKNYRHKVAAHFALTAPRKGDNMADLLSSVMTNVIYAHGYLRAGAISEILYDENGKEIKQKTKTSWSLTKTHENLIPRYWPNGPDKFFPSIKISAKTTRKFIIDWEN